MRPLIASELYDLAEASGISVPGLQKPDEDHGKRVIGLIMGRIFKDTDTATVDEFTVSRDEFQKPRDDGGGGFIAKRYTFSKPLVEQDAQQAQ